MVVVVFANESVKVNCTAAEVWKTHQIYLKLLAFTVQVNINSAEFLMYTTTCI